MTILAMLNETSIPQTKIFMNLPNRERIPNYELSIHVPFAESIDIMPIIVHIFPNLTNSGMRLTSMTLLIPIS